MDISVITIGNSKGIMLTKTLIQKYNITDKVELILEKDYIIIKPKKESREGWESIQRNAQKWRLQIDDLIFLKMKILKSCILVIPA